LWGFAVTDRSTSIASQLPRALFGALGLALSCGASAGSFVYDGRLDDGGRPAQGQYDILLTPWSQADKGQTLSAPIRFHAVAVNNGQFRIEFEAPLGGSEQAWLEVAVRDAGASGAFNSIPGRVKAQNLIGQCWSVTGDSGSNPLSNFLGTIDAQPLVLRTNNVQSLRIEPSAILFAGSPNTANVVAGSSANSIDLEVRGATIAGGGSPAGDSDPDVDGEGPNSVSDHYGTVGGGYANHVSGPYGTVSGGRGSLAQGTGSVIGGGEGNSTSGSHSVIGGGQNNLTAGGFHGTIGGGLNNTVSGASTTIGGGEDNDAISDDATVSGGRQNLANAPQSTIAGGQANQATGSRSTVSGGNSNRAGAAGATVAGGQSNTASGLQSMASGGFQNCAGGENSWAGGNLAKVRPGSASGAAGTGCVGVPLSGDANGDEGTFVWADTTATYFTSAGPNQFLARASGGVGFNTPSIPSHADLVVAQRGTAIANVDLLLRTSGRNDAINIAMSPDVGGAALFVAQYNGTTFTNRLVLEGDGDLVVSAGAFKPGGGSWAASSDARLKSDVEPMHGVLERLLSLRGVTFRYTDPDPAKRPAGTHDGLIAQEVAKVFPSWVQTDSEGYLTVGPQGFEALAVEALRELRAEKDVEIKALAQENAELRARLERIEQALGASLLRDER
jgi:hypothetical protein